MARSALLWGTAEMTWRPDIAVDVVTLRVVAFIERYAAEILGESLRDALLDLAQDQGRLLEIDIEAGHRRKTERSADFTPGAIAITADRLTERFDPHQLRRRIDELVNQAVLEGDVLAERDEKRARQFLDALAHDD